MNILYFISSLHYGGAEKQALLDANMMVQNNKVFLLCFSDGPQKEILDNRVSLIYFKKKNYLITANNLAKLVKHYKIQLINSSLFAPMIISALSSLLCKVKVVWHFHSHEYELPLFHRMVYKWLPRLPRIKKLCFVNNELIRYYEKSGFDFPRNKIKLLYNNSTIRPSRTIKTKPSKYISFFERGK